MVKRKTVSYDEVLKKDFYCQCGTWIYSPQMNETKIDDQKNEVTCIGGGCTKQDEDGEFMECPECKMPYYLV
ncbi:MAG: hypothetical protein SVZ03_10635 [Spirochaetota bacterium]|nr:hypothetical protein [Spirochaetota bacterium]